MILEITGTNIRNKGAELLLQSILKAFKESAHVKFAVASNFGPYEARAKYGVKQMVRLRRFGRSKIGFDLLPETFLNTYGLVSEKNTSGVLDASGFSLGDQLPQSTGRQFAMDCKRWHFQKKNIILLPQALGPFNTPESKKLFRTIAKSSSIIYARDSESLRSAQTTAPEHADRIHLSPDITLGLKAPENLTNIELPNNLALLIPNYRMIDKFHKSESKNYIPLMAAAAKFCANHELQPTLLIHDSIEDHKLVEPIRDVYKGNLGLLSHSDPLMLKGMLKQARLVIGSRYHALLGALSSGVPSIGTGWSHKYQELFNDFECPDMLTDLSSSHSNLEQLIQSAITQRELRSKHLITIASNLSEKVNTMWKVVSRILGQNEL